jgi:hypothetical protein
VGGEDEGEEVGEEGARGEDRFGFEVAAPQREHTGVRVRVEEGAARRIAPESPTGSVPTDGCRAFVVELAPGKHDVRERARGVLCGADE